MISRRLLRIKAFQAVYSFFKNKGRSVQEVERELMFSVDRFYDLYFYLLLLPIEVKNYGKKISDNKKNKKQATYNDLNPNFRFFENKIITCISDNEEFNNQINGTKLSWNKYPSLIKSIYTTLVDTDAYIGYMNKESHTFKDDKDFINYFYTGFLYNLEELYDILEEQSIFWNNDIDFALNTVGLIVSEIKENSPKSFVIPKLFKKEDDKDFLLTLYRKTVLKQKEFLTYIDKQVKNWDIERISDTDKIVIILALCEITEFSSIPIKVSFNEYIELGKMFGTQRSGAFINGVLEIITAELKKEKKINKIGRGLV